jgi:nicotinamide-nucleotide amidase
LNAEILSVGTELLLGDIVNTNAAAIARGLAAMGINVYHQAVVGDNAHRLEESVREALSRSDLLVMTGGLGPTYDDLTKETVAAYFKKKLVMHPESLERLERFFLNRGRPMTENNKKQAMMPEGCIVINNDHGTAPGCIIEQDGKIAIMMPGPPREMVPMFEGAVFDYLSRRSDSVLVSQSVNMFNIGEAQAEETLREMMLNSSNPTIAPYAKQSELSIRVTARAANKDEGLRLVEPVLERIEKIFPQNAYGRNFAGIHEATVKILSRAGHTFACAESCTGGLVASRLVDISGSSQAFLCGVVAYSNEAKQSVLGVDRQIIESYGAVSEQCALAMARGIKNLTGADIAVSTTGIAGPNGAGAHRPVGLVYVAAVSAAGEQVRRLNLARGRADDRETIRSLAAAHAMFLAINTSKELSQMSAGR